LLRDAYGRRFPPIAFGVRETGNQMVKIYDALADAGWQHPETLTWINDQGEFLFGAKVGIINKLDISTPGAQAIVEYGPDSVARAVYLNLKESNLVGRDNFRLRRVGGYSDTVAPVAANG